MRVLNSFDSYVLQKDRWDKTSHYASGVGNCRRQMYYQWIAEEESNPNTPGSIIKMDMGKQIESYFEKWIIWAIENEIEVDGYYITGYDREWKKRYEIPGLEFPLSCSLDFVLHCIKSDGTTDEDDIEYFAIELKSSFGRGISDIQKNKEPKIDYLKQIFVYSYLTPFKKFIHPYIGRDSGYRTEFFILLNDDGLLVTQGEYAKQYNFNFDKLVEKLAEVEKAVNEKQTPERDFLVAIKNGEIKELGFQHQNVKYKCDWQCNYCNWRDKCWSPVVGEYQNGHNADMFEGRLWKK